MRPVNLILPEDRRGERAPLRTGPVAYILVAFLVLAFAGVYAVVSTGNSISERQAQVTALEQELESSAARADALRSFSDFASLEQTRTATVSQLAASRFDWERVLREMALVLPEGITLTKLTGGIPGAAGDVGAADIDAPSLTIEGCTTDQEIVAGMIASLRDIDGVTRVGLAKSTTPGLGNIESEEASAEEDDGGTAGCGIRRTTQFEVTIAFDEATAQTGTPDAAAPAPSTPAPPAEPGAETAQTVDAGA